MSHDKAKHTGIIAWFATNPVAANLLMIVIIVVGLGSALTIKREMFPAFDIDAIMIVMTYPGAAPEEVEQGLVLKIEEAINDLDGINRVKSDSLESMARVFIEPQDGYDFNLLLDDVKNRLNAIQHFPEDAEKPIVGRIELRIEGLWIQITGELDERSMKNLAQEVRRELMSLPEVNAVDINGTRDYEISIEISEQVLQEYHLSLGQVANIIAASSLDLPAGSVETESGDIMLRTRGQAYVQQDFESIVLKNFPDGTRLTLGDIARVNDSFVENAGFSLFNNRYSVGLSVFAVGSQDVVKTVNEAKAYVEQKNAQLPPGVHLEVWSEMTYYLNQRLLMMLKNLTLGAVLVFIVLALFLEIKLAFWVMLGIPVCFFGALAVFNTPLIDGSLNMISIFGLILVLGIVVDDAIIIGESAYSEQEKHGHSVDNVINGVHRVATPATFGVLTTIVAFAPTLFIEGVFSAFPEAVGWVVMLCLVFSLVESKWILPAHLAHSKPATSGPLVAIDHIQERINIALKGFVRYRYIPLVTRCLRNRYTTLGIFISMLILAAGLVASGNIRVILAPETPGEFVQVEVKLNEGAPARRTLEIAGRLYEALKQVEADHKQQTGTDEKLVASVYTYGYDRINGTVMVELTKEEDRSLAADAVLRRWREAAGRVHGVDVLAFSNIDGPGFGPAISLDLTHKDFSVLRDAGDDLAAAIATYPGTYDIRNGAGETADEFHFELLPEAEALGISRFELGSQVRNAFYGAEAQRMQRGADEVKVMVRYPDEDRKTTATLGNMYIRTPTGDAVPLDTVARVDSKQGLRKTTRIDFQRAAEVSAEVDRSLNEPSTVLTQLEKTVLPKLQERYPGLGYIKSGMSDEESKMARSMFVGFALALFGIYALLAVPTKSYLQPLIIMGVIPFGIIGAIIGHWMTGYALSIMSLMGVIALSGVVVNDSLILVDHVNKALAGGEQLERAVLNAGSQRFRAIMLTSLTTFFGLAPMLLERSSQAQQIVPMAISLAFGILFATVITLLLVPCLYMILQDLGEWWSPKAEPESSGSIGAG